jgi:hypothetical protein
LGGIGGFSNLMNWNMESSVVKKEWIIFETSININKEGCEALDAEVSHHN